MTLPVSDCIADEVLAEFISGLLIGNAAADVERHLIRCARCAERVRDIRQADPLVDAVRHLRPPPPASDAEIVSLENAPPSGPAEVRLQVLSGPLTGRVFAYSDHQTCVVGRAADAQLRPSNHRRFSRYHCRFEIHPPQCRVVDLGSRNGTLVNGARVADALLRDGDEVTCGDVRIRVLVARRTSESPEEMSVERSETGAGAFARTVLSGPEPAAGTDVDRQPRPDALDELPGYRLVQPLGKGGMGTVYLARHRVTQRNAAVKLINPASAAGPAAVQFFLREVSVLSTLRHPRIVELIEFGLHQQQPYIVMEYIPAVDFAHYLRECSFATRLRTAVGVVCRVLEGLQYAHENGIVHRDVKPSNVLVFLEKGKLRAKLADFGLAKNYVHAGLSDITGDRDLRGTLSFMPPEQALDCRYSKPPCDVFSAGACLYYWLSGHRVFPFEDATQPLTTILTMEPVPLRERDQAVPEELAAIVDKAVSREPGRRFASAEEMRQALLPYSKRRS